MNFFGGLFERKTFDTQFDVPHFNRKKMGTKGTIIAFVVTVMIALIWQYFNLVALNFRNPAFIILLIMYIGIFIGLSTLLSGEFKKYHKALGVLCAVLGIYVVLGGIISSPIFHAAKYQAQLNVNKDADFYSDNQAITFNQIPVVDRDSAMRLGDRKMGEIMDYVSQFDVSDDYNQINYKGRPTRVTPLNYAGIIKWLNNFQDGLPAYISVDMVSQEAEIIRLEQGMKYSESDKFFRNIHRYLFVKYPTKMFDTLSFEIDEEGVPYFVAPVYDYTISFFGGKDIVGAVLVNACDGSHQYYDIDEVPTWLDRVYPEHLVMTQLENWGKYTNGFLNTYFGQKGMLRPTDGYNYITIDDDVYFYTGLTSVMADQSNVGFALINLRTKEAKFYNIPGAEENSAMQSAQGQVQHLGYKATFPILINVGGVPTYFMALKDSVSLVKMYAFVSVENYNVVATGENLAQAQKSYIETLANNGQHIQNQEGIFENVEGKVERVSQVIIEGNSQYYFKLENDSHIYIAPIQLNEDLPLMVSGDDVKVSFQKTDDHAVIVDKIIVNGRGE